MAQQQQQQQGQQQQERPLRQQQQRRGRYQGHLHSFHRRASTSGLALACLLLVTLACSQLGAASASRRHAAGAAAAATSSPGGDVPGTVPFKNRGLRYFAADYNIPQQASQPQQSGRHLSSYQNVAAKDKLVCGAYANTHSSTRDVDVVFIEIGANNGAWTKEKMQEIKDAGKTAKCFMFEPQPKFTQGVTRDIAKQYGCTLVPHPVWISTREFTFHEHSDDKASSLMDQSQFESDKSRSYNVTSVDIVEWLVANVKPTDNLFVRMDIEGAEYEVVRHLIIHGVACWFNTLQLEFHALHHKSNYNKRPADSVFPWLLRACGVHVETEVWYPKHYFDMKGDPHCSQCQMLSHTHNLDRAYPGR